MMVRERLTGKVGLLLADRCRVVHREQGRLWVRHPHLSRPVEVIGSGHFRGARYYLVDLEKPMEVTACVSER